MSSSLPPYEPQPSYLRSLMHDYHQQINAQTDATVADLQQRWVAARAAINADIARLQQQMETAIANGDQITYAWLADAQRLAALKASVEGNIAQFADATRQLVADGQLSALDLGTNAAQEALAATVPPGVAYTFGVPPADVLHAQAGALSPSSPLTALFAQLGPDAAKSAQAALFTSVALGEGPHAAATRLFWNTNLPRQRAEVIARTEILRSWRGAQMENYRANSDVVSGWQWSADFSDRTCGACIAMDGTIHTLDEDLDDHIMGRCSALPITRPWSDILAGTGADTSDLTETSIASWDSYLYGNGFAADWFEGLAPEVQNSILGPAKAEAYRQGDLDLKDLAGVRKDALWGDSIEEVSLKQLGLDAQDYLAAARANGTESVVADAEALAQAQAGTPAAMAEKVAGEAATAEERYAQMVASADTVSQALRDVEPGREQLEQLAARLEDNPAFAKVIKRLELTPNEVQDVYIANTGLRYQGSATEAAIANIQAIWNGTIGMNADSMVVALRMAVRDEFGLTEKVTAADADIMREARSLYRSAGEGLRALARASYDQTQEWFADQGITELTVYRGRSWIAGDEPNTSLFNGTVSEIDVPIRAISSWSADPAVALDFATSGGDYAMVAMGQVPVSQVWATAYAGFGTPGEAETLLMGDMQQMNALSWNNAIVSEDVTTTDVLQRLAGVESSPLATEDVIKEADQMAADAADVTPITEVVRSEEYAAGSEFPEQALESAPPFSMEQFAAADLQPLSRDIKGANDAYMTTIDGQQYIIKDVRSNAPSDEAAFYRAHAESASTQIAHLLGFGDQVMPTYAFEADGRSYVASEFLDNAKTLAQARGAVIKYATEDDLRNLALQEYLVGETDRNNGNYLFEMASHRLYTIDHSGAFAADSGATVWQGGVRSGAARVWQTQQGINYADTLSGSLGYDRMTFDPAQIADLVAQKPQILNIMRANGLDAGIPGVEARIEVLNQLSQMDNPTYYDLYRLGEAADQYSY